MRCWTAFPKAGLPFVRSPLSSSQALLSLPHFRSCTLVIMLAGPIALFSLLISSAFAAPVAEQKPARRAGASVVSLGSRSTFVKRGSNVFDAESAKRELLKLKTKYSGDWSKPASAKTKRRNKSLPFKPKTGAEPFDVAPHRKRHRKENADAFGAAPATVTVTVTAGAAAADATSVAANDGAAANSSAASSSAAATGDASTLGQEALEGVNSGGVDILYFGNMTSAFHLVKPFPCLTILLSCSWHSPTKHQR